MQVLEKHLKYEKYYKANEIYFGIGIENETYLEIENVSNIQKITCLYNQKPERYSVNYYGLYKENVINNILKEYIENQPEKSDSTISLPMLINAHSFLATDLFGNHKTTYERVPKHNECFKGKTIIESLEEYSELMKSGRENWYTFDGDSIEFMTLNFYNNKIENVIEELVSNKKRWITELNNVLQTIPCESILQNKIVFAKKNYGFANFLTNRKNTAIFNNGTYHINITLPTMLNDVGKIKDMSLFTKQHQNLARLYQYVVPFFVGKYGSGDIYSNLVNTDLFFPVGSQRLTASRYVSACTYDTEKMERGKILTIENKKNKYKWYDIIYESKNCVYKRLSQIGLDINFNKHYNHGLELRIFDSFDEKHLDNLLRFIIYLCDESLLNTFNNPLKDSVFNEFLARVLLIGPKYILTKEEIDLYNSLFNLDCTHKLLCGLNVEQCYDQLFENLCDKFNHSKNTCTELMIKNKLENPNKSYTINDTLTGLFTDSYKISETRIENPTNESNVIEHVVEHVSNQIDEKLIDHIVETKKKWFCCFF
jgi:hypothetical protein